MFRFFVFELRVVISDPSGIRVLEWPAPKLAHPEIK